MNKGLKRKKSPFLATTCQPSKRNTDLMNKGLKLGKLI